MKQLLSMKITLIKYSNRCKDHFIMFQTFPTIKLGYFPTIHKHSLNFQIFSFLDNNITSNSYYTKYTISYIVAIRQFHR